MASEKKRDKPSPSVAATEALELALKERETGRFVLRLYIGGLTPNSQRAVVNVRRICDQYLNGRYLLEIIDIFQQPALAREKQIIAVPTLIKELPLPLRRLIGDMSKLEKILILLDLKTKGDAVGAERQES